MTWLAGTFWASAGVVLYAYVGYPCILLALRRVRGAARGASATPVPVAGVSVVAAAHNEAGRARERVAELARHVRTARVPGEVVLVSDGSTDGTADAARAARGDVVRVIELSENRGKAAALNEGVTAARYGIVVFADIRQTWSDTTLSLLIENFADPTVGAVSGDLVIESAPGVLGGVGLYWRYEKWLRRLEGAVASVVGVSGSISAVRRELFRPIPPGTILDDVYWPMHVAMQGFRIVHDSRAHAFDRLPASAGGEFRRKVRTLSGNFQLVARCPALLLPWRNPLWFQFGSHKMARLAVPWAMLAMLTCAALGTGPFWRTALAAQATFYGLGLLAIAAGERVRGLPLAAPIASYLMLNAAAWMGFWVWASGRAARSWSRTAYSPPSAAAAAPSASTPTTAN